VAGEISHSVDWAHASPAQAVSSIAWFKRMVLFCAIASTGAMPESVEGSLLRPADRLSHWYVTEDMCSERYIGFVVPLPVARHRIAGTDTRRAGLFDTIEGDQIKLRSQLSALGDSVGFIFAGTLAEIPSRGLSTE
jgi:hypothetical protein